MKVVNDVKEQEAIKFEDLPEGHCFRWGVSTTDLLLKTDYEHDAVSLINGEYYFDLCDEDVFPVNAEVHIID